MNASKTQQGFTLIELVIVIVILGILAATALPRFMNVTEQAHTAAVQGAGGGLGTAVQLVRAQWVANGDAAGADAVANFGAGNISVSDGTTTSADGWPVGIGTVGATTATTNAAVGTSQDCADIWTNVLQNPPSVLPAATTADYNAVNTAPNVCTYTYLLAGTTLTTRTIVYNATSGAVTITTPP